MLRLAVVLVLAAVGLWNAPRFCKWMLTRGFEDLDRRQGTNNQDTWHN